VRFPSGDTVNHRSAGKGGFGNRVYSGTSLKMTSEQADLRLENTYVVSVVAELFESSWIGTFAGLSQPTVNVSRPIGGVLYLEFLSGGHLSKQPTCGLMGGQPVPTLGLAPSGVYIADQVTLIAGVLLPHRFNLACVHKNHRRFAFCCTVPKSP